MKRKNWLGLLPLGLVIVAGCVAGILADAWGPYRHNISPVMVDLDFVQIRYYGLVYMLGFILMFVMLRRAARRGDIALKGDDLETFILLMIAGVVLGARLFEVFIYNPGYYLSDPVSIIKVWEGGLSFHGGLTGAILAVWFFSRKKGRPGVLELTDMLAMPALGMLALGRMANFINGELYGGVTTAGWGVLFSGAEGYRHPVQIYESFKNLLAFSILYFVNSFRPARGVLTCGFLITYGAFRFVIEFFKDYGEYGYKTLSVEALNVAHLLCFLMVLAGVAGLLFIRRRDRAKSATG